MLLCSLASTRDEAVQRTMASHIDIHITTYTMSTDLTLQLGSKYMFTLFMQITSLTGGYVAALDRPRPSPYQTQHPSLIL